MFDTSTIRDNGSYVIENLTEHNIELPDGVYGKDTPASAQLKLSERQLGTKLDKDWDKAAPHLITVTGVQVKALALRPMFRALVMQREIDVRPGNATLFVK